MFKVITVESSKGYKKKNQRHKDEKLCINMPY